MHPVSRKGMIMLLLLLCQCFVFGGFIRYYTIRMVLADSLISRICLHAHIPLNMHPAFFKHPEVMCSPLVRVYTDDPAIPGYDQLCFVGMSLLFAGVILPLFFFYVFTPGFLLHPLTRLTISRYLLSVLSCPVNGMPDSE